MPNKNRHDGYSFVFFREIHYLIFSKQENETETHNTTEQPRLSGARLQDIYHIDFYKQLILFNTQVDKRLSSLPHSGLTLTLFRDKKQIHCTSTTPN